MCRSVLLYVAVCCRVQCLRVNTEMVVAAANQQVLWCDAECCRVLQGVAECCRVLQSVAVCCSVLQCVARD